MNSFLSWITTNQQMIYIVILMVFVGIEVIGRVPGVLHTPLMSGANAIHAEEIGREDREEGKSNMERPGEV